LISNIEKIFTLIRQCNVNKRKFANYCLQNSKDKRFRYLIEINKLDIKSFEVFKQKYETFSQKRFLEFCSEKSELRKIEHFLIKELEYYLIDIYVRSDTNISNILLSNYVSNFNFELFEHYSGSIFKNSTDSLFVKYVSLYQNYVRSTLIVNNFNENNIEDLINLYAEQSSEHSKLNEIFRDKYLQILSLYVLEDYRIFRKNKLLVKQIEHDLNIKNYNEDSIKVYFTLCKFYFNNVKKYEKYFTILTEICSKYPQHYEYYFALKMLHELAFGGNVQTHIDTIDRQLRIYHENKKYKITPVFLRLLYLLISGQNETYATEKKIYSSFLKNKQHEEYLNLIKSTKLLLDEKYDEALDILQNFKKNGIYYNYIWAKLLQLKIYNLQGNQSLCQSIYNHLLYLNNKNTHKTLIHEMLKKTLTILRQNSTSSSSKTIANKDLHFLYAFIVSK